MRDFSITSAPLVSCLLSQCASNASTHHPVADAHRAGTPFSSPQRVTHFMALPAKTHCAQRQEKEKRRSEAVRAPTNTWRRLTTQGTCIARWRFSCSMLSPHYSRAATSSVSEWRLHFLLTPSKQEFCAMCAALIRAAGLWGFRQKVMPF